MTTTSALQRRLSRTPRRACGLGIRFGHMQTALNQLPDPVRHRLDEARRQSAATGSGAVHTALISVNPWGWNRCPPWRSIGLPIRTQGRCPARWCAGEGPGWVWCDQVEDPEHVVGGQRNHVSIGSGIDTIIDHLNPGETRQRIRTLWHFTPSSATATPRAVLASWASRSSLLRGWSVVREPDTSAG